MCRLFVVFTSAPDGYRLPLPVALISAIYWLGNRCSLAPLTIVRRYFGDGGIELVASRFAKYVHTLCGGPLWPDRSTGCTVTRRRVYEPNFTFSKVSKVDRSLLDIS